MKKGLFALSLLPAMASAHLGPSHSHPEELLGALALVVALGVGLVTLIRRR